MKPRLSERRLRGMMTENWIDYPDRVGEYWMSVYCNKQYVSPRIVSVIDCSRPDGSLDIQERCGNHGFVSVREYCAEWYPKAKWMLIKTPVIPKDETEDGTENNLDKTIGHINIVMKLEHQYPLDFTAYERKFLLVVNKLIQNFGKHQRPREFVDLDLWHQHLWGRRAEEILEAIGIKEMEGIH